jgi:hypothetical protein
MTTYVGCDKIHAPRDYEGNQSNKIHAPRDYEGNQSKWVLHVMLLSFAFTLHLVEHGNKCPW